MAELNIFDKLWFNEVKEILNKNFFHYKTTMNVFYASRRDNSAIRYIIKINKENIEVTIPLKINQEYTTKFTEYFKVVDFLLYHIREDLKKYAAPHIQMSERMFH